MYWDFQRYLPCTQTHWGGGQFPFFISDASCSTIALTSVSLSDEDLDVEGALEDFTVEAMVESCLASLRAVYPFL